MMKMIVLILLTVVSTSSFGQPNCNVYKMKGDEACYQACETATTGEDHQGHKSSQQKFDKAIELCPGFAYAYMEKSVPYLKRGDFITWKKLLDKAVELDSIAYMGYRGWCRYQFLRDYKGAIRDFEKLDSLTAFDIGYSINGDYHLNVAKALCYKALGDKTKAIQIMEDQLSQKGYLPMIYDYLHVGVLKMEAGDMEGGIEFLNKSIAYNDYLAEPYYYLALIYKKRNQLPAFKENIEKAKAYYLKGRKRVDPYTHPLDKIYLTDIEKELTIGE